MAYQIPKAVQKAAAQALEWHKQGVKGTTKVGLNTARILAKGGEIGIDKVRHIAKYFPRHEVDKQAEGWSSMTDITPGKKSWYAWGGDAGWKWASSIVKKEDETAAVKGPRSYKWAKFTGGKSYTLNHKNGKTVHKLSPGETFGHRASRSGKYSRVIVPALGPTYVFTLTHKQLTLLLRRSQSRNGPAPVMKKDNRMVKARFTEISTLTSTNSKTYGYSITRDGLKVTFPNGTMRSYGGIVTDHLNIRMNREELAISAMLVSSMTGKTLFQIEQGLDKLGIETNSKKIMKNARSINKKLTSVKVPGRLVLSEDNQNRKLRFVHNPRTSNMVASLETAGSVNAVAAKLKKFKFNVDTDGETLTATHQQSPLVKVTLSPVTREKEDGKEETVYVMEMDSPLYDNAEEKFFIKVKTEGNSPTAAFDAWYPAAVEAFGKVKKLWAKEVNGQIGKRYYWLTGFFAKRYNKSKK